MVLSLADFIEYLRQRDFDVGVDHLLRAQILLETIDEDYPSPKLLNRLHEESPTGIHEDQPPDKLKARLSPLFANNREEQRRFYKAFDDYVNYLEWRHTTTATQTQTPPELRPRTWKRPAIALALLAAVVIAIIFGIKVPRNRETGSNNGVPSPTVPPVSTASPLPTEQPVVVTSPTSSPLPSTSSPSPSPAPAPSPSPAWQPPAKRAYLAVFVAGMLLFLLYEVATHLYRHRLLHTQRSKSPPFSWPLSVKRPVVKLYRSDQFFQAVRRLRRRRIREYHRLNIYATIAATIRSLGYPSFRYKPDTNIPEYLMLIERKSFRDHQAHLFDELFKSLRRDGLYVTRFFYDRDPRRCFDETGKNFQHLSELRAKYFDHRLLIFGDCDKFLEPVTGKLAEWAEIFSAWHDRAILTPVTPALWSFREANLVNQFSILPATVAGLNKLSDTFAPPITRELGYWKYDEADVLPRELNAENVVAELRPRLGEDVFQWLCACALYPELQWNLTLMIGSLPCMKADLVSEENLLRLVRLPWFSIGEIPEDVRLALSQAVDQEKEIAVRAMLVDLLAKDEPPGGTFAADTYSVELALHQWLTSRIPENLRRLRLALKNIPANEILNNRLLVDHLRRLPGSLLSRLMPPPLRQGLSRHGVPYFGFGSAAHFLLMLLLVMLVSLGMRTGAFPVLYPKPAPTPTPLPSPSPIPTIERTVVVGDDTLRWSPNSANRGSEFPLTITLAKCVSNNFNNSTLGAPAGFEIKSTAIADNGCKLTAIVNIPANASPGSVTFTLRRTDSTIPIPFTVTAVDCPTITVNESRENGNYRFTAVVVGGQPLSQPGFVWEAIARDQQGQSIIDSPVPFTGQGTNSILIQEEDNSDDGIFLMVDVTVTGYDTSCRVNGGGGGFPDARPSLIASPQSIVVPCQDGSIPATCSQTGSVIQLTLDQPASLNYSWGVTGGRITTRRTGATWDLAGAQPGSYTAMVRQIDNRNRELYRWSVNVTVDTCKDCKFVGACPTVSMSCTDVREGDPLSFIVNLSGGSNVSDLKYSWTVSNGKIIGGGAGPSIDVETDGLAHQSITATVSLGGLSPACSSTASCSASIQPGPASAGCKKFDEFENPNTEEISARLDNYAVELQNDPKSSGYIIVYSSKRTVELRNINRFKNYLFNTRGMKPDRVKIVEGPSLPSLTYKLWICPPGVQP